MNREPQIPEFQLYSGGGNKKKIIKREIFIWMKARDKKEGKNFLFCMIEEEKALDVQIKWQIRKSDISDF